MKKYWFLEKYGVKILKKGGDTVYNLLFLMQIVKEPLAVCPFGQSFLLEPVSD